MAKLCQALFEYPVLNEITTQPKFSFKSFTDNFGFDAVSDNTYSYELVVSSPLPFYNNLGFVFHIEHLVLMVISTDTFILSM